MGSRQRRRRDRCTVVECYTPRRVVARWLSGLRSSKEKRDAGDEHDERGEEYQLAPIRCLTKRLNQSRAENSRTESQSKEAPLAVGIGSFLLYLLVASKTELDKMANLRMQMEMLLLNVKEELQKKEFQENLHMSSNDESAHHVNDLTGCQFSPQDISNLASSIFEESSTSVLQEENTECEVLKPEDYHRGTDCNSELQVEVSRFRLDEIAEDRYPKHKIPRQNKLKDNEVTRNHMPEMVVTDERYEVCPYELEKKLHELLETRHQEELIKLETALSRVERRLQEKENEVSWLKDAARLLAQRVPETSRVGLEWYKPESSITCSEQSVPKSFKACPKRRISFSG